VSALPPRRHGVRLAAIATAIHLGCDALASRLPWTTPPYLLLDHAGDLFRSMLELDRTAVLGSVAFGASAVNGVIAALLATALAEARRRRRLLAAALFGLWVFSGGLMTLAYLSPPWGVALGSLAAGLPRSLLVAWALDGALGAPVPAEGQGS